MIGLLVIVNPANLTNPLGLSLAIGSALTFGLYSIVTRWGSFVTGYGGLKMTCYTFLVGSAELLILISCSHINFISSKMSKVAWLKDFASMPIIQNVNLHYFWILFFVSVCVTGGGFAFYFLTMDLSGVSMASLVFFLLNPA